MEIESLSRFAALSHPLRMAVFRLLMRRYPDALPAGEIAQALEIKASTLSVYLSALAGAGLVAARRRGTARLYRAEPSAAREMLEYLVIECGRGREGLCPELPAPGAVRNVLFLCSGNSARSIFAEAILSRETSGRVTAHSAGTHPRAAVDPRTVSVLSARGHDPAPYRAKALDVHRAPGAPRMDVVITVCDRSANETVPPWPGRPVQAHWGVPDPVAQADNADCAPFEAAYAALEHRIRALVSLPLERLDRVTLQHHLDTLGHKELPQ